MHKYTVIPAVQKLKTLAIKQRSLINEYEHAAIPKDNAGNRREFFEALSKKLNISTPQDWYKLTTNDVIKNGGRGLIRFSSDSFIEGESF